MLLKMSLNSGNRFCMYFVDLFAVSLVSWICMIVVLFSELFIRLCRFGSDVLSDDAFHVIIFVSCSVSVLILVSGAGVAGGGGGCEYSLMLSRHHNYRMAHSLHHCGALCFLLLNFMCFVVSC